MTPKKKQGASPDIIADTDLGSLLKSEVGERPRVEVRLLKINAEGKLEELSCYPLSYYGSCPNVGDTIVDGMLGKPSFYSIQRRYFVGESAWFSGWALIVREIDPTGPPLKLWEEWQDATKFWDDVADQKAEELHQSILRSIQAATKRPEPKKPPSKTMPKTRRKRIPKPT
ncbi:MULTISPECIES: hypothetical protein [unclassified Rhizobium]|uniref:hypothetical protein n=1 Tax=unclassified Rhizobium TaxID=2613769 RepID=UPI0016191C42|nr:MULTISPECIES: hypothetical protein [unclassified Rhizobium]MBB3385567.1 hypothetical protein [Rhizobium sp. BK098]MBB3617272.1 hypothetical protein [Rhizobium sp. BK609]MBB3682892.1 hypothetical protein [Rhizobium sp. BK612]